jgi:hypothetical protein
VRGRKEKEKKKRDDEKDDEKKIIKERWEAKQGKRRT